MKTESQLTRLAAATPVSRDRYVDLLRAFSILVVVLGHWLMAIVYLDGERLDGANALDVVPGLWLATWFLQVMPLFFFVGGFSNSVGWKSAETRGIGVGGFLRSRCERLMRPTLVFAGAWTAVAVVVHAISPSSSGAMARATELLAKPLWFLAVYLLVVALSPAMLRLHHRHGARVLATLAAAVVVVDVVRIAGGLTIVGYLNFAFVWLFAHQLGFFYADGSLTRLSRRALAAMGAGALSVLAILTASGIYSPSMVGMETERASNNSPPTICLIVLTVWLVSAAMALRPAITRWLERRRNWTVVVAANSMIMTIFLWHLTALLVAVLVLFPLGFPQPVGGSAEWWALRPVWVAILAVVLAGLVAVFARFERPKLDVTSGARPSPTAIASITGVVLLVAGLAGFAQSGFAFASGGMLANPLVNSALVFAGHRLVVGGTSRRTPAA
ncbi:MAG TPA: acyltransferase [Actinomycetota bacterium]|jgi:fucose 4-O-acetylase-like acetyltransferase